MEQGKLLFVVILVLAITLLMCNCKEDSDVESFVDVKQSAYLVGQNRFYGNDTYNAHHALARQDVPDGSFVSRPQYAAVPRVFNGSYTSTIHGAEPPSQLQGVDAQQPIDYAKMAAQTGDDKILGRYSEEQVEQDIYNKYLNPLEYVPTEDLLPQDTMENTSYGKLASDPEVWMPDRLIFANQKRRNLEGADFIRGDLPIQPDNRDWHQVSVKPHLDLRKGAIAHHIGPDYESFNEHGDLQVTSSRGFADQRIKRWH